jgi:hypothetical protein
MTDGEYLDLLDPALDALADMERQIDVCCAAMRRRGYGNSGLTVNPQLTNGASVTRSNPKSGQVSGIGTPLAPASNRFATARRLLADVCNGLQRNATQRNAL